MAKVVTFDAPTAGIILNADPSRLPSNAAIEMTNIFPEAASARLRGGSRVTADLGTGEPVETVLAWVSGQASKLVAASGSSLFSIDAEGEIAVLGACSEPYLSGVPFSTEGENALILVNGADPAKKFDGAELALLNATDDGSDYDTSQLVFVTSHKSRLYFIERDSLRIKYFDSFLFGGELGTLFLGGEFTKGGKLVALASWSVDGGAGMDDMLVAVTDRGQVAVFSGSDPGSLNDWQKIGVFDMAPPMNNRCFTKVGGEIGLLATAGVFPLSASLAKDEAAAAQASFTAAISPGLDVIRKQAREDTRGWQFVAHPALKMALINTPVGTQHVANVTTGAWGRYDGWQARCFVSHGDDLYFGDDRGRVLKAEVGYTDDGAEIAYQMVPAFKAVSEGGSVARFSVQLTGAFGDETSIQARGLTNYQVADVDSYGSLVPPGVQQGVIQWDEFTWDQAAWRDVLALTPSVKKTNWRSLYGWGHAVSIALGMKTRADDEALDLTPDCRITKIEVIVEPSANRT